MKDIKEITYYTKDSDNGAWVDGEFKYANDLIDYLHENKDKFDYHVRVIGKVYQLIVKIEFLNEVCNTCEKCYFYDKDIGCPVCEDGMRYSLVRTNQVNYYNAVHKLCNHDICVYYENCSEANLCLIKLLFEEA